MGENVTQKNLKVFRTFFLSQAALGYIVILTQRINWLWYTVLKILLLVFVRVNLDNSIYCLNLNFCLQIFWKMKGAFLIILFSFGFKSCTLKYGLNKRTFVNAMYVPFFFHYIPICSLFHYHVILFTYFITVITIWKDLFYIVILNPYFSNRGIICDCLRTKYSPKTEVADSHRREFRGIS